MLCLTGHGHDRQDSQLEGRYFGGILGYGYKVQVSGCTSASGRAKDYIYDFGQRDAVLLGQYVGGILGYGADSRLAGCQTQRGGYVLGSDYVGGIAGGLSNDAKEAITGSSGIAVTTNASYVIGNSYVGGIVGKNDGERTTSLTNCINNGIAAGYERYIGGIVGYNGENGHLYDCASYLSDYSGTLLRTIVEEWKAAGDCAGGLAGYNNGLIEFTQASENITVKSVSSIVVGKDYVGGVVGFNDSKGTLEVAYTLIGGQIHAYGNAAGGCMGLNASAEVLTKELTIKPVSVTGNYYVGGCIGANVVDMVRRTRTQGAGGEVDIREAAGDIAMDGFRADNALGSITGKAFAGGVIGYQRTYAEEQLRAALGGEAEVSLLDYLDEAKKAEGGIPALLPELDGQNVPGEVLPSENPHTLTIGNRHNSDQAFASDNNNMPAYCDLYTGGILGYCQRDSRLIIKNCRNGGRLSGRKDGAQGEKVSLKAYLGSGEVGADTSGLEEDELVSMCGGIIGSNLDNQVIDHCANSGTMNGFVGLGGIVGCNAGGVFNCELTDNFGNAGLDYIGGIAGLNVRSGAMAGGGVRRQTYRDANGREWNYASGMIAGCSTKEGIYLSGKSYTGGIAGYNLRGARLEGNVNRANVTVSGDYAGGMAGANGGEVLVGQAAPGDSGIAITGNNGKGIGGIVGWNQSGGTVNVAPGEGAGSGTKPGGATEVIAVDRNVSVIGKEKVGGIIGVNQGSLDASAAEAGTGTAGTCYLVCQAKLVRATGDCAGGIIGEAGRMGTGENGSGTISRAVNRSAQVTADNGRAGGIVAVNYNGISIINCQNNGNINSDQGYAGGIAAENYGTIADCTVEALPAKGAAGTGGMAGDITIGSQGADALGAVCAVNYGQIRKSGPVKSAAADAPEITLSGTAVLVGGVAGKNAPGGMIGMPAEVSGAAYEVAYMPKVDCRGNALTVGGVAGANEGAGEKAGWIGNIAVSGLSFEEFGNYRYLGGIVGDNRQGGMVEGCAAGGERIVKARTNDQAGNCYGGIAGRNSGSLTGCEARQITINVKGVYTATATSTAAEKEALSTHAGGIVGMNQESGLIRECQIGGSGQSAITVASGMAGGIAGYNKGSIELSGAAGTKSLMTEGEDPEAGRIGSVDRLVEAAEEQRQQEEKLQYVVWSGNRLEDQRYNDGDRWNPGTGVQDKRSLLLTVSENGNLGGITAYNGPTGSVSYCATGNWFLNNKSEAIGVGTGGIIGMNESEQDLSFLLNRAFVGRELANTGTNRFAGGIVGNQNNTTVSGWSIRDSVNGGMVYCRNAHYAGGIIGQWTGRGGSVERCHNYGNLQTTCIVDWLGASAGIVAQLYHAYEDNEYNIVSCGNYGNIYGKHGRSYADCANDSAGILGNITAYNVGAVDRAQRYTINVTDCVNGAGVEIYSYSMASGIVGFFSCDDPGNGGPIANATANIALNIVRCRNYADVLSGRQFAAGIFGDRYGKEGSQKTAIQYCFSLNRYAGHGGRTVYPIISYKNGSSEPDKINGGKTGMTYNYFLSGKDGGIVSFQGADRFDAANGVDALLKKANTMWAYRVPYKGESYFICLYEEKNSDLAAGSMSFPANPKFGDKIAIKGKEVGYFLFAADGRYDSMDSVTARNSGFDGYVRRFCFEMAGMLVAPEKAVLWKDQDNHLTIEVEAPAYPEGEVSYEALLYRKGADGAADTLIPLSSIALGEDGAPGQGDSFAFSSPVFTFSLNEDELGKGGELYVAVKAVQGSGDAAIKSAEVLSNLVSMGATLPEPRIRIELIEKGAGYAYRFRLANLEEYAGSGDPGNAGVEVFVKRMDGAALTFDGRETGEMALSGHSLQQLTVWVTAGNGASSPQISVPVYLPAYTPEIALQGGNGQPGCTVTGDSLENLRVSVTIPGQGTIVTTPPVYRAELVGTWTDQEGRKYDNTVFKSADILTTSSGQATAVFADLPEYIARAADIKVRLWYAESGLGPVYTYSGALGNGAAADAGNANIRRLTGTPGETVDGTDLYDYSWECAYTPVLEGNAFGKYRWTSGELLQFLPAPVLMELPPGQSTLDLETAAGRLQYVFSWDQGTYQPQDAYLVSLKGLVRDEGGNITGRVSLLTDEAVEGNSLTVDAEDWSYGEVELTVTRKGTGGNGVRQIGLTSTRIYAVKRRLPQPAQPRVANPDVNELNYRIEWDAIAPETGCQRYEVYVQLVDGTGTPGSAEMADQAAVGDSEGGIYRRSVDLERYAGQRVLIYVRACPAEGDESYVYSVDGVTYGMTVPGRIPEPKVQWSRNWEHRQADDGTKESVKTVEEFQNGSLADGLRIDVAADPDSIPPGGSSYLLKAYVFQDKESAERASQDAGPDIPEGAGGLLETYPARAPGGEILPVQMETAGSADRYAHAIGLSARHAGKYILCYARISSGQGLVSSPWVRSDIWQLPYVKLSAPSVAADSMEGGASVTLITNPDLTDPDAGDAQESVWTASHTALAWDSVDYADTYRLSLAIEEEKEDGQTLETVLEYKLAETAEGLALYWKNPDGAYEPVEERDGIYELPGYRREVTGQYEKETDYRIPYQTVLQGALRAEELPEQNGKRRFTLVLPDASSLTPPDGGNAITDSGLRFTRSVRIEADVQENDPDGGSESDAYVGSAPYEIQFRN